MVKFCRRFFFRPNLLTCYQKSDLAWNWAFGAISVPHPCNYFSHIPWKSCVLNLFGRIKLCNTLGTRPLSAVRWAKSFGLLLTQFLNKFRKTLNYISLSKGRPQHRNIATSRRVSVGQPSALATAPFSTCVFYTMCAECCMVCVCVCVCGCVCGTFCLWRDVFQ